MERVLRRLLLVRISPILDDSSVLIKGLFSVGCYSGPFGASKVQDAFADQVELGG